MTGPDFHMAREIAEEPALLRSCAPAWSRRVAEVLAGLEARGTLVVVGRGSSRHAGTFLTYLLGMRTGRCPIELRPWLTTLADAQGRWDDATALAYSASGQSTDVAHAARWLRDRGAQVIAVTNATDPACNVGREADAIIELGVGEERAVPATKSLCAQLFVSAAVAGFEIEEAALETADAMEELLRTDAAERLARFIDGARSVTWIARGPALAAAQDAALKLQEAVGLPSAAYSAAEFLHGPIGATGPGDRALLIADDSGPAQNLEAIATRLLGRGVPHRMIAEARPTIPGDLALRVPLPATRWARTPVLAMLAHGAALSLACWQGKNPDLPTGLQKVTLT